jgi:hypothetical protein
MITNCFSKKKKKKEKKIGCAIGLTWALVVAHSEVGSNVRTDVGQTLAGAVLSVTSEVGRLLPDNLGEVAPVLEVGHVWLVLAVETVVPAHLAVVEQVGDDGRDVVGGDTSGNVLAVTTSVHVTIVMCQ